MRAKGAAGATRRQAARPPKAKAKTAAKRVPKAIGKTAAKTTAKTTYRGGATRARNLAGSRREKAFKTITTQPLTPVIGSEVIGLDLTAPLKPGQGKDLSQSLAERNVLVFRDQPALTPDQQIDFARTFGDLHIHPAAPHLEGRPEIFIIHTTKDSQVANGNTWHTDVSCDVEPPMATMLQLHILPKSGGDTLFSSMYAAWDALSEPMQAFLSKLTAVHESEHIYRGRYTDRGVDDSDKTYPSAEHPVVRTHPVSGRQALYVNRSFTTRIRGLPRAESDAVLRFLFGHMEQPEFQVRVRWEPNTIVLWDNRCSQHYAMWDYWPEERRGQRVTIKGDRPFFRAG